MFQAAITKTAATGSQFTIRHNVTYDQNNAPGNQFPSVFDANVEAEIRQPILQGAGLEFNRIAGPSTTPGVYNGVLVARINTDVALTDFEIACAIWRATWKTLTGICTTATAIWMPR